MQLHEKDVLGSASPKKRLAKKTPMRIEQKNTPQEPSAKSTPTKSTANDNGNLLDRFIAGVITIFAFLFPFFLIPGSTDILELPKQTLLFGTTLLCVGLYFAKLFTSTTVEIRWHAFFSGPLAILGATLIASIFSLYPYQSFLGIEKQQYASFATLLSLCALVFVMAQTLSPKDIARIVTSFLIAIALCSIYGILQLLGVHVLPLDVARSNAFTPIGRVDLWGGLVVTSLLLALPLLIHPSLEERPNKILTIALSLFVGLGVVSLLLLADQRLWISFFIGLAVILAIFFVKLPRDRRITWLLLPSFLTVFSAAMIVWQPNFVQSPGLVVDPSIRSSMTIALSTIVDRPAVGYGPGTFLASYTKHRNPSVNMEQVPGAWELKFDQSGSFLASYLASTGLLGFLALLACLLLAIKFVWQNMRNKNPHDHLMLGLTAGLVALAILAILKPWNISLSITASLALGGLLSLALPRIFRFENRSNQTLILSSVGISAIGVIALIGGYSAYRHYTAEFAYARALEIDRTLSVRQKMNQLTLKDIDPLIKELSLATTYNPYHHAYPRTLSQALNSQLNGLMTEQEPNPDAAQRITSQLIDEARKAVAASPVDVRNTENLALAYQGIAAYVKNADEFALKYFKESIALDPGNPAQRVRLASFLITESLRFSATPDNENNGMTKEQRDERLSKYLTEAKTELQTAIELKPNFAIAHYTLGIISAQQGDKAGALARMNEGLTAALVSSTSGADTALFHNFGLALKNLGDTARADRAFSVALALDPSRTDTLFEYALLLESTGNREGALAQLEKLQELTPENQEVAKKIQSLRAPVAVESPQEETLTPEKATSKEEGQ